MFQSVARFGSDNGLTSIEYFASHGCRVHEKRRSLINRGFFDFLAILVSFVVKNVVCAQRCRIEWFDPETAMVG